MGIFLLPKNHQLINKLKIVTSVVLGITGTSTSFASPAQAFDFVLGETEDPVLLWNDAILEAISKTSYGPTPASRALGIVNTSIFDAWAAYDEVAIATQPGSNLQVPSGFITDGNKQESISYAAYTTLVDLFPSQVDIFNNLMVDLGYDPNNNSTDTNTAAGIGNRVANTLLDLRYTDGSNQLNNYADTSGYNPVNTWDNITDPGRWQPLSPDNGKTVQKYLTPHWGSVTPFALKSGDQFLAPPPEPFQDSEGNINQGYINQALEIIEYSAELTDEQKVIAEYWADGPGTVLPPGHWHVIGQYISERDNLNLDENVELFFGLSNAVMDAGIAAWNAKTYYDYIRPISAVRYLAENKLFPEDHPYIHTNPNTGETEIFAWGGPNLGSQWIRGSQWLPYQKLTFITPPFAEYVSGHSTFSAASADILRHFTGSDAFGACYTQTPNSSAYENNTPATETQLCWDTFTAAADQAGMSRRYGGIHFTDGDINGRILGRKVGDEVWKKVQYFINGGKRIPEPTSVFALLSFAAFGIIVKK